MTWHLNIKRGQLLDTLSTHNVAVEYITHLSFVRVRQDLSIIYVCVCACVCVCVSHEDACSSNALSRIRHSTNMQKEISNSVQN